MSGDELQTRPRASIVETQQYEKADGFEVSSIKRPKRRYFCRYLHPSYSLTVLKSNMYLQ